MRTLLLYSLAFFSGFAALIYQVAWSRMLSLTFGSTTLAVSAVVAGFLGGMGIGAWLYHRVGDRVEVPLRAYGGLEIGIALSTLLFTALFVRLPEVLAAVAGFLPQGVAWDLFRIASAFVILLLPSALMGATYPALCQSLIHSARQVDTRLGWIYGLNTLGAAVGALAAGFVMIEALGSRGSVTAANAINLAVGGVALLLAARATRGSGVATRDESLPSDLPLWVTGVVLFGSGFATLGYEIVWFRALRYLMGNGTYVLSTALVIFLTGLGIGGVLYRVAVRIGKPEWNLGLCQLVIALLALVAIAGEQWVLVHPELNARLNGFLPGVDSLAWQARVGLGFGIAVAIMLPATVWMGLSFPLASRIFLGNVRELSSRVGLAYLLSNLGSIAGAILAATWILPHLGTVGGTKLLAGVNVALGLLVLLRAPGVRYRVVAMAMIAVTASLAYVLPARLTFRTFLDPGGHSRIRLVFEQETDLGTVQVVTRKGEPNAFGMAIDGIVIGVTRAWLPRLHNKQLILAHLPMVLDRSIRDTLNLGVASGSTLKTLSRYDWVESLDAVEINPAVLDAGAYFLDTMVLDDPRADLHVEDALHHLLRTRKSYDLIVSDAKQDARFGGTAKVLSEELYRLALRRLNECGLFVQFLPLTGSPESLKLILRTFLSVFPETELFMESPTRLVTVGSRCPIGGRQRPTREELEKSGVAAEIEGLYVPDASRLPAIWLASGAELEVAIGDGPINSWDKLSLEFLSYRLPASTPEQTAAILEMLHALRDEDPRGNPAFTDDPWFIPLLELQRAHLDWTRYRHAAANRRVDRVLEEHPDLALAHRTKGAVQNRLVVDPRQR